MAHDHGHHHHHGTDYSRAFAIGVGLNVLFVVVEAGYGFVAGSLALIADAGHNASDVLSLLLAWGAALLAKKAATPKRTYGFGKVTIMASLASAVLLLVALGGIAREAFGRIAHPESVQGAVVIVVAAVGVVVNTVTALLFVSGRKEDLNIRGAFLHMAADAGVSLGVVLAGVLIEITGWPLIDPILSLAIVAIIFAGTWSLLRDSMNLAIDAVPAHIDIGGIRDYLADLKDIIQVHDLHVWPLSTTKVALTVHLITSADSLDAEFLPEIQKQLHDQFGIAHSTIQIEQQDGSACMLDTERCD